MVTSIVDSSMELNVEQCNTSAASDADDIPEEIQIEILSRLPPESLSRCKCVSKRWDDTLTIQAFLVRHSRSYDKYPKLALVARSSIWGKYLIISHELNDDNTPKTTNSLIKGKFLSFDDFPISKYFYMSNICNDLICLFNPNSTFVGLLNIQTRDFIKLPAITKKYARSTSKYWYALGFDPVYKVFKVLSITYGRITSKECTNAAILTIGSNYWNPIDYKCFPSSLIKSLAWRSTTNSLCLDGVIYWFHKNIFDDVIVHTVFAFDLNCETFRDYELDKTPKRDRTFGYYLTCLKERPTLFISKINKNGDTKEVEQWTLFNHKNPNAAWKMRNITNHNFPISVPYGSATDDTLVAGGSILLHCRERINSESNWYLSYDLENIAIE